jgi:hypothetical protein
MRPARALIGDALDDPEPFAPRQARAGANMRTNCGNPDCYHNVELDFSGLPDNVTFGELQRRMLCTVCDHRGADVDPNDRRGARRLDARAMGRGESIAAAVA